MYVSDRICWEGPLYVYDTRHQKEQNARVKEESSFQISNDKTLGPLTKLDL